MQVKAFKTEKITKNTGDITKILDKYLVEVTDESVVAVTSKIVSICEGRVVLVTGSDKDRLIEEESQYYLPREDNPYQVSLTIINDILAATAGIDESNAQDTYVLWPTDPVESANRIRAYLQKRFGIKNVGVIITDSKTSPLRWGVTAQAIGYSGFEALKSYIDTPDLFGRQFKFEKLNIADSLATSASVVMGEGSEQTPIALITDIPFVTFVSHDPTQEELASLKISIKEDIFAPLLTSASWKKGKKSKE